MTDAVIAVKPRDSAQRARALLEKNRINQLPVVVDGKLVGIVTDRDLRDVFPSVLDAASRGRRKSAGDPERVEVESMMTRAVVTLTPRDTLDKAASLMRSERIGAIPVVANGKLVGIVSRSDVLDAYIRIMGRMNRSRRRTA